MMHIIIQGVFGSVGFYLAKMDHKFKIFISNQILNDPALLVFLESKLYTYIIFRSVASYDDSPEECHLGHDHLFISLTCSLDTLI